ncbi:biliverdin-producing heme oxygenase [Magnetospirillum sp. ME-1]|uniref:biliverdin-producing heme oxygenase n=1 Tax=Magnetospirillum sp. ME-1 TaxID=1639348 RepID=UPI00143D5DD5|nr:biliverdin-producing heme oxygenase [Magnetospirillum sp. ME-1]
MSKSFERIDDRYGLRDHLRSSTKAAHRLIDHHPLMRHLIQEGLTCRVYGDILVALYTLHAPTERALLEFVPETDVPRRSDLLKSDIEELGRVSDLVTPSVPQWDGKAPLTLNDYIGMRYVIEGSAIGGRSIREKLMVNLECSCKHVMRFFDGQHDRSHWQRFWVYVDQLDSLDATLTASASNEFFHEISELFDRHLTYRNNLLTAGLKPSSV